MAPRFWVGSFSGSELRIPNPESVRAGSVRWTRWAGGGAEWIGVRRLSAPPTVPADFRAVPGLSDGCRPRGTSHCLTCGDVPWDEAAAGRRDAVSGVRKRVFGRYGAAGRGNRSGCVRHPR
ncbi:hypothetical protein GCM10010365_41680 [Streptomyces poonensis]|uniref:Uncharacterized protein n=1 Tax=Streptomyces poonensis TaxID=68255 RepID=A0A918PQ57_9ACTN|nr:hypothetical protein GCM10010365_41680 [Streptomyces poonensis]GLJ90950.1 hypothetical protein GCM10017589_35560 [Streptomyces poonensis]